LRGALRRYGVHESDGRRIQHCIAALTSHGRADVYHRVEPRSAAVAEVQGFGNASTDSAFKEGIMSRDPGQHHQIEQDAIIVAWKTDRLSARDGAIALLREIADLERDDDGAVIIGTGADGQNDVISRIAAFLADNRQ
jgi:hypothetical protein